MVYAIQSGKHGPMKFGVAKNPWARLEQLQTGNPETLKVFAAVNLPNECERQIHDYLRGKGEGLRGEWFKGAHTCGVASDLWCRERCKDHVNPADHEYAFWMCVWDCDAENCAL